MNIFSRHWSILSTQQCVQCTLYIIWTKKTKYSSFQTKSTIRIHIMKMDAINVHTQCVVYSVYTPLFKERPLILLWQSVGFIRNRVRHVGHYIPTNQQSWLISTLEFHRHGVHTVRSYDEGLIFFFFWKNIRLFLNFDQHDHLKRLENTQHIVLYRIYKNCSAYTLRYTAIYV